MKLTLPNVRLAFPAIFEPTVVGDSDKPAFGAAFIFPPGHPSEKAIKDACISVAKEKWGAKWEAIYKGIEKADKLCIHDGDTKAQYDGYEGNLFVNARNPSRPSIKDRDGVTPLVQADGKPYAGCYVYAFIEIYAQDNKYGKRINATLRGIQFFKDGDAFSGSAPAQDNEFEDLSAGIDEDYPLI